MGPKHKPVGLAKTASNASKPEMRIALGVKRNAEYKAKVIRNAISGSAKKVRT
jgi:hypothetical protein